jgi:hypothetical protein
MKSIKYFDTSPRIRSRIRQRIVVYAKELCYTHHTQVNSSSK